MDHNRLRARRALRGQVREEEIVSVASSHATLVDTHAAASVDSGSRNRKAASEGDHATSEDVAQYLVSNSPSDSMTNVPQGAISDSDNEDGPVKCKHGEPAVRKYCWEGADTGRYFYCFRRKEKPCNFIKWIDLEWAKPVQTVILTMWGVVQDYEEQTKCASQCQWTSSTRKQTNEPKTYIKNAIFYPLITWTDQIFAYQQWKQWH
ncbi:hypothetical protein EJB05_54038, partial [Eragrostis curvula]